MLMLIQVALTLQLPSALAGWQEARKAKLGLSVDSLAGCFCLNWLISYLFFLHLIEISV